MFFQYLGTAASEAWPALFCNCPQCKKALALGGRDIRTRSQAILDDHILFDFPCDTYQHKLSGSLDLSAVDLLLITHSHSDHLYPNDIALRTPPYSHDFTVPVIHIASGVSALNRLSHHLEYDREALRNAELHTLRAYETVDLCGARILPIPAYHLPGEDAFCYSVETKGVRVLYLHDTGERIGAALEPLRGEAPYDLISFDCCWCTKEASIEDGHMGLPNVVRLRGVLYSLGLCTTKTVCCVNHFSHNIAAMHSDIEAAASPYGILTAYDGRKLAL
ncbi:MAG: MBL fold metallo-hydrolase [Clostridiaceae bacterium]|nr:MBL fold metallo-hydrolase [Clostridiaceae bacterium]